MSRNIDIWAKWVYDVCKPNPQKRRCGHEPANKHEREGRRCPKKQCAESGCVALLLLLTTAECRGEPLPARARYRPNEWARHGVQFGWNRGAM